MVKEGCGKRLCSRPDRFDVVRSSIRGVTRVVLYRHYVEPDDPHTVEVAAEVGAPGGEKV